MRLMLNIYLVLLKMKIDNSDMFYEDLEKYKRQHRKRQKDMREVKRLTRSVERFLKQKTNVDAEQKYYWEIS